MNRALKCTGADHGMEWIEDQSALWNEVDWSGPWIGVVCSLEWTIDQSGLSTKVVCERSEVDLIWTTMG